MRHFHISNRERFSYLVIPDGVSVSNANAVFLTALCVKSKMLVVNNLKNSGYLLSG